MQVTTDLTEFRVVGNGLNNWHGALLLQFHAQATGLGLVTRDLIGKLALLRRCRHLHAHGRQLLGNAF